MPQATITVDPNDPPLSLVYSLSCSHSPSDQAEGRSYADCTRYKVPYSDITYAIRFPPSPGPLPLVALPPAPAIPRVGIGRRAPPPAPPPPPAPAPPPARPAADTLWITGVKMFFEGRITALPPWKKFGDWKAGFIQSIYKSERHARYQDGSVRKFRMNTTWGPLKDGDADTPFYGNGTAARHGRTWTVTANDAPNFKVPMQFGPNQSRLTETYGNDCFCTFLVLARERDKSIIELSRVQWQISWEGRYDQLDKRNPWLPTNRANFLQVSESHAPKLYATLNRQPGHVPFSLQMAEAENFCEILENGEWKPCNPGGDTTKPGIRSLRSWRTSVVT